MKKEIYVLLRGRIGNQLFIYAFARSLQERLNNEAEIIIDDSEVLHANWENSLVHYDLQNVRYVHDRSELKKPKWFFKYALLIVAGYFTKIKNKGYMSIARRERLLAPFLNLFGIVLCENGYKPVKTWRNRTFLLSGYFQSEKYFRNVSDELKDVFSLRSGFDYPFLSELENTNSVCISVKVEHNVGSSLYAVCGKEYWQEAIEEIVKKLDNPIFFVCSDNVDYVREHLIDCSKYKVIFQDKNEPVYKSLAAMSRCKHFIIGNTTYGWWAQYLCDNPQKIVFAPNQWMLVPMPIDIYQDNWTLIDVKKHLGDKAL